MWKNSFKIDKELYQTTAIEQAVVDFSDFAITFDPMEYSVTISGEETTKVFLEFMNYALALQLDNKIKS
jgi:hypothetical protein